MTEKIYSCKNCNFSYLKEIDRSKEGFGELVYICKKDNHYIGYPEDAEKEVCDEYKQKR